MKRLFLILTGSALILLSHSQTLFPKVVIETSVGNMTFILYDGTPMHSENFTKLINEGYYNNQLFHRVIKNFMIQGGDPESIDAESGKPLGSGGPGYTIPPEFSTEYYHKKGALAAARLSDEVNPGRESSGSQFYIVQGTIFTDDDLDYLVSSQKHILFTEDQINDYTTIGGTPHLDYAYTVFGELVEGIEVLDKIASRNTDSRDRPRKDVKIIKAYTLK